MTCRSAPRTRLAQRNRRQASGAIPVSIPKYTIRHVLKIGVDSYSYHRLLGELRPGEEPPTKRWSDGLGNVLGEAIRLHVDVLSLQTCFLDPASKMSFARLASAASALELIVAWGAPDGLRYGSDPDALADLLGWIDLAAASGIRLVRIVLGSPRHRQHLSLVSRLPQAATAVHAAAERAAAASVRLAVENHGDLRTDELVSVLDRVDAPEVVGVCFDTANALRVGEDVTAAARALTHRIEMVHLKDIEALERVEDPVAGPRSVPYGSGVIPIADVVSVLRAAGFAGALCVELGQIGAGVNECDLVAECVHWLRTHLT